MRDVEPVTHLWLQRRQAWEGDGNGEREGLSRGSILRSDRRDDPPEPGGDHLRSGSDDRSRRSGGHRGRARLLGLFGALRSSSRRSGSASRWPSASRTRAAGSSVDNPFRQPPLGDDKEPTPRSGVQVLEFPRWFVCQNPACRALVRADGLELKGERYLHECTRLRKERCVPVRFVAACKRGHVQDFPWVYFAHRNVSAVRQSRACSWSRARPGTSSRSWSSAGPAGRGSGYRRPWRRARCRDARGSGPWLGAGGIEGCEEGLRLLVRSASNAYFSQVVSAISIPEPGRELAAKVKSQWDILKAATAATLPAFRTIETVREALAGYGDEDVLAAVEALRMNVPAVTEPLRTAEFRQLVSQGPEQPGDLPPARRVLLRPSSGGPRGGAACRRWRGVVLVRKLREVRVEVGFTRIEPVTPNLQGEFDLGSAVRGAGPGDRLAAGERGQGGGLLSASRRGGGAGVGGERRGPSPGGGAGGGISGLGRQRCTARKRQTSRERGSILLHSLAHLLISAVSLEGGYSASAIRERIYCAPAERGGTDGRHPPLYGEHGDGGDPGRAGRAGQDGRRPSPGAPGTSASSARTIRSAPRTPRRGDHSERFLEGAACHGCLFIAEPSCERFNRYLDRALVVPAIGHAAELAFWEERP